MAKTNAGGENKPKGGTPANPLKDQNQRKGTTQAAADQAAGSGRGERAGGVSAAETVTGQGGSDKGGAVGAAAGRADTRHPSQHGGVTADDPASGMGGGRDAGEDPDRPGVKRAGPSPADEPSNDRTGTAPDRSGGPTRSGKTDGSRRKKGRDV